MELEELVAPVGSTAEKVILSGIDAPTVVVLDQATGEEAWRIGESPAAATDDPSGGVDAAGEWNDDAWDAPGWESGLVLHDNQYVYTQRGSGDGSVVAYNVDNGSEAWRASPGSIDPCAPADGWWLSPSRLRSYEVGEQNRLIVSHTDAADPSCHDGPTATHPGRAAMVVIDTATGEVDGEPLRLAGTAIPSMSMPDISGRYVDTPYELQGSVNVVRRDIASGDESWAMLDYPEDFALLEQSPTVSDMGGDRFLITYLGGTFVEAAVDRWAADGMETGDVSTNDLGYEAPCEYRSLRSGTGVPYCLTLTSSPDPSHVPMYLADEFDESTGEPSGDPLEIPAPELQDEHYGFVVDRDIVENDDHIAARVVGGDRGAVVVPSEGGLSAVEFGSADTVWAWDSGEGMALTPHVVPGVDEVLVGLSTTVASLDARTGEHLWDVPSNGPIFGVGNVVVIADYESSTTRVRTTVPVG